MTPPAPWLPLLPAHAVRAGAPPVSARLQGEDLVAWRSAAGALQVWRARCPHRGVHLGLGRVVGDRLACAYHGWEFEAGSGRCVAIPALADLSQVPGRVHAAVCAAREWQQMVWVRLQGAAENTGTEADSDSRHGPATAPSPRPDAAANTPVFLRSMTVRTGLEQLQALLRLRAFTPQGPAVWQGVLAGKMLRLTIANMQPGLVGIHAWACQPQPQGDLDNAFCALRRLRADAEAGAEATASTRPA